MSNRTLLGAVALAALALLSILTATSATAAGIRGIDVSRFQGHIAWKQVGLTRTKFAFLQASRGSGDDCLVVPEECGVDPTYLRNYKAARAQGIRVGAYHRAFASDPGTEITGVEGAKLDAREEANLFVRHGRPASRQGPPPGARPRDALQGPRRARAAGLGQGLARAGREPARGQTDHLHEQLELAGDR